jgi:hypothetical protein
MPRVRFDARSERSGSQKPAGCGAPRGRRPQTPDRESGCAGHVEIFALGRSGVARPVSSDAHPRMESEVKPGAKPGRLGESLPARATGRASTGCKVLFRAKLGAPLGGARRRSTPDLCLWTDVPRRAVTIRANSASVISYGCRPHCWGHPFWGRPLGGK